MPRYKMKSHLFVIVLFLTLWSASPEAFEDLEDEEFAERSERNVRCKLTDGRIINDGNNFTRLETGLCVYYLCKEGNVFPLEYGCYRNHHCHPLHHVYKLGCIERTCELYEGHFEYVLTKEGCLARDMRTCVEVGSTYQQGCFHYRCDKQQVDEIGASYHLEQMGYGCELNGQCVPVNHTYTQGCRTMRCEKRIMNVGFFTVKDGCEINSKCVDVGSTVVDNCRTFNCTVKELNGLNVLNIDPIKIQCKDTDGECHDSGAFFPIEVNQQRVNCTCQVLGYNIEYSCPSVGSAPDSTA